MNKFKVLVIIIFLNFVSTINIFGINSSNIDVESIGSGNSGVAIYRNPFSPLLNPSLVIFNDSLDINFSYILKNDISDYGLMGLAINYSKSKNIKFSIIGIRESLKDVVSQNSVVVSVGGFILPNKISIGINGKIYSISPSGYQEDSNDPLLKSYIKYKGDIGALIVVNSILKVGVVAYNIIDDTEDSYYNRKYKIGINSSYNGYSFNFDSIIEKGFHNNKNEFNYFIGIEKKAGKILTLRAGLDNFQYITYGVDISIVNIKSISKLIFQYAYTYKIGSNHCIGMRCKF